MSSFIEGSFFATYGALRRLKGSSATGCPVILINAHRSRVHSLAFSASGMRLASAGGSGKTVSIWNVAVGTRHRMLRGCPRPVGDVAFSPPGEPERVAALYHQNEWYHLLGSAHRLVWDADSGEIAFKRPRKKMLANWLIPRRFDVQWSFTGAGGRYSPAIAVIDLWRLGGGQRILIPLGHNRLQWNVIARSLRRDLGAVLVGSELHRFNPEAGTIEEDVLTVPSHYHREDRITAAAIPSQGDSIALGYYSGRVDWLSLPTLEAVTSWQWDDLAIGSLVFSPEGTLLAAGGDRVIQVWETG